MCKKPGLLVSIVLLLSIASISSAASITWSNGGDGDWNNNANWIGGAKPNTTSDYARINTATGPVFIAGRTAVAYRIFLEGSNGTITVSGGSLTTNNHIYVGAQATDTGTLDINSGDVNILGTFYVSLNTGGNATVNLSGGTIRCNVLNMRSAGGTGTINISNAGTLIINGDVSATIAPWITSQWIKAYNGAGTINVSTTANPGKTTVTASAPAKAANPTPANSATNVNTFAALSWTGIAEAVSHDVYFGTISPPTLRINTTETNFNPGMMTPNTTYYWKIDEVTGSSTITGDVWSFTTGSNIASNPNPANAATNVSPTPSLTWTAGVSALSHNVYFGTSSPPASIGNQTGTTYTPATLSFSTTYYWRIDEVRDSNVYTGTVWSFTTAGSFSKGPYLIYPGSNSQMTVLWQLPSTQSCTLAWGTDTNYSAGSAATTEYGTDHQHKYTITGLTSGTKYYYRVTAGSSTATGSFRSAPAIDANNVKFIIYGDTRTYPDKQNTLMTQVNSIVAADPAFQTFIMHSGDWVETADEAHWASEFFNRTYAATAQMQSTLPIMGGIGNHEINGDGISVFDKYWPFTYAQPADGRYYSFDYGPVHIAVVDMETATYNAGSAQLQWLESDLAAASSKKWKIVMFHEPGWSATGATNTHANNSIVQTDIEPILEHYGVQAVFTGHNHYYSRAVVNGIHHVTSGGGGAPFYGVTAGDPCVVTYTANVLEFCKVEVTDNTLTVTATTDQGQVIDLFYVNKAQPDLTFVQVTDVQFGMEASQNCPGQAGRWTTAISKLNMINPAFVVDTGDHVQSWNVSSPYTTDLNTYLSIAAGLKPGTPFYHVPGNHDIGDAPAANRYPSFLSVFPNPFPASSSSSVPWYSFSYGNTLFIVLDTLVLKDPNSYMGEDTIEMNWLTNTLQNSSGYTHKIVFTHVPICKASVSEADDSGGFNMPSTPGLGRAYSNIRASLLSLFHQYGVQAVFCGHAHVPYYVNDNGLELITSESTTCPLGGLDVSTCGMQIVKIYPDHIEHKYLCLDCISSPSLPGDFNGDGVVDDGDLGIFVDYWMNTGIWP